MKRWMLIVVACWPLMGQACGHPKSNRDAAIQQQAKAAEQHYKQQPTARNLKAWTIKGLELTNHLAEHECHCHSKK